MDLLNFHVLSAAEVGGLPTLGPQAPLDTHRATEDPEHLQMDYSRKMYPHYKFKRNMKILAYQLIVE